MSFVGVVCLRTYHVSEAVALKSSLILACCMDQYMLKAVSCDVSDASSGMPAHWHLSSPELTGSFRLVFAPISSESYACTY